MPPEMQEIFLNFPKIVGFLAHFLKKKTRRGRHTKQLQCPSKIGSSYSLMRKPVSLKIFNRFQTYISLQPNIVKKSQFHKENDIKK